MTAKAFTSAQEFLQHKRQNAPACLVLDVRLPGLSGLDLQRQLGQSGHSIPIIFITGHGDIPMSVRAMKEGAVEFLTKPFRDQDLLDAVGVAIERNQVERPRSPARARVRKRVSYFAQTLLGLRCILIVIEFNRGASPAQSMSQDRLATSPLKKTPACGISHDDQRPRRISCARQFL
jgi:DNA-binding response OmpR family regulator